MAKPSGLALVMLRNEFYRDGYWRAVGLALILIILNVILAGAIIYKWQHPMPPQYFPVDSQGKLIKEMSLSDPVFDPDKISQWAADAAQSVYEVDFSHWREELQRASENFTGAGWQNYLTALKLSNNLKTVMQFKMVTTSKLLASPQIIEDGVINGVYEWKVKFPLAISYIGTAKTVQQIADITMVIQRVPLDVSPQRIAVNMFVSDVRANT